LSRRRSSGTVSRAIHVLALIFNLILVYGPHIEIRKGDINQRDNIRASDHDRCPRDAVIDCAGPVVECQGAERYGARVGRGVGFPVLIDIYDHQFELRGKGEGLTKAVRSIISPKILKHRILHITRSTRAARERLDHEHLRALININIPHRNI